MLHRKKPSYFREKSVKKSKNPKMLWKALKSLGLNSKERNKAKVSLKKDGTIQFEPRKNTNIFRKFYPEVAANLLHLINLIVVPKKIIKHVYLTIKETNFSYSAYPKMLYKKSCLA